TVVEENGSDKSDNKSYDVIVEESDSDDGQSVRIDVRYWYRNDTDVEDNSQENEDISDDVNVEVSDTNYWQSRQLDDASHEEGDLGEREITHADERK
ncbi:Hypothetical predicted protein, partial [Paramuricea clavata]